MKPKKEEAKSCPCDVDPSEPTHKTARIFKKFGKCVLTPGIFITKTSLDKQEKQRSNHHDLTATVPKPSIIGHSSAVSQMTSVTSSSKSKSTEQGSSSLRQLLPVTLCIISFATVMSILIIYIDTTGKIIVFFRFFSVVFCIVLHFIGR